MIKMYSKSEKEDLVLSYFSILDELYNWNFQTYDVVIHDDNSNKGLRETHNKILKTLVFKDDSDVTSIIQGLLAKDQLVIINDRYSSTRKTHWNDIIEIREEQQGKYKHLSAKLIYQLDLGISEILNFDHNLILLNLIINGVPLEKLKILYPKELNELLATGLTDGEKVVGFNESHYLYYKFNEYLKGDKVTFLVKNEKLALFSGCRDYEKAIISILTREKVIAGKGIDYYSVQERTLNKWERLLSEIVVNIDDKIAECAKIIKLKPLQITQVIHQLKLKGLLWENKDYTYSVVHEIVLEAIPQPPDDFIIKPIKDFDLDSIPKASLEEKFEDLTSLQKQEKKKEPDQKLVMDIKRYIQGFSITTKFSESPTPKKVEKLLSLLKVDLAKYGWSEEKEILRIITNEFELIIEGEKISNTKWRKFGKLFLKGLGSITLIPT